MFALEQKPGRTFAVWLVVIGTHATVISLLGRDSLLEMHVDEIASIDLLLIPPEEEAPPDSAADAAPAAAPVGNATRTVIPSPAPRAEPTVPAPIDWDDAARSAAVRAVKDKVPEARVFGETVVSPYRECQRKKRHWEWIPQRKKGGFSGGLPWVQVSDHCVVGLGFFGCAIGELPPPKGDLLDDMGTSNEMQSTVPGIEDCVEEPPPSD